jgi:nitroimidazol reductase NimA-like FMN-containing flavoprotein (pyridoxamine 5'-phosphate oxidase superfamily)
MDTWSTSMGGRLTPLTRQECLTLLGSRTIGRVAFCLPTGPVVLPVNYAMHEGAALFRTSSNSSLGKRLSDGAAALEVDDLDETTRSGWSVLLRGYASTGEHPELPRSAASRPRPWARGTRMMHIRIVATEISGRRLDGAEDEPVGSSWLRS